MGKLIFDYKKDEITLEELIFDYKKGEITTSDGKIVSELYPLGPPVTLKLRRNWRISIYDPTPVIGKQFESSYITALTESHHKANAFMYLKRNDEDYWTHRIEYFAVQFYKIRR